MKNFKLFSIDTLIIVLAALCFGLVIGRFCPQNVHIAAKTFFHNIYVRFHPEIQKDAKTIIIEKVSETSPGLSQNSIFDEPEKRENPVIRVVKRVFCRETPEEQTIHDFILH